MNCEFLKLGNGKAFFCSHCGAAYHLCPKNRCWETKELIDVLEHLENNDD